MSELQCDCWCGSPSLGAQPPKGGEDITLTACNTLCTSLDMEVLGCYTSEAQWPTKSEMCWTKAECTSKDSTNEWEDAVEDCYDTPIASGHCYAAGRAVTLIEPFGGNTSFTGLSGYVSAAYQFLVPVAAMLAVVIIMIAGAQYILARGNMDQVKKARSRIGGAVTGLILLLSAWTIANLIDPRLVNQKQLRVPMLKEAVLLDPTSTCEYLASQGFGISPTKDGTALYGDDVHGDCNNSGYIVDMSKVAANVVVGSWSEGSQCTFSTCPDGSACAGNAGCSICGADQEDDTAQEATCAAFEKTTSEFDDNEVLCRFVEHAQDTTMSIDLGPACGRAVLNCKAMVSDGAGCRAYDLVTIAGEVASGSFINFMSLELSVEEYAEFCEQDLCGLAWGGGCTTTLYTLGKTRTCVSTQDAVTVDFDREITGGTCYNHQGVEYDCVVNRDGSDYY